MKNYDHFCLRTEVKEAEKFDDALFCYRKKGETVNNVRYCQIKNSEIEKATLQYSDFVSDLDKAVANIKKYFISYRKIKMTAFCEKVEDFIFCTSYKLPLELPKSTKANENQILNFYEDDIRDKLFGFISNEWKRYKIGEISSELQNSLNKTTNFHLLAEEMTECIIKSKKNNSSTINIDLENFWISLYQSALENEKVIVRKGFTTNTGKFIPNKKNEYVFSQDFLKNESLTKECENFRSIFLDYCGAKFMNIFLRDKHFPINECFNNLLENEEDSNVTIKKIKNVAIKISEHIFYDKPLTDEISEISLGEMFKTVDSNTVKFNGNFVKNENLSNNIKLIREHFLESYTVMELRNMNLKLVQKKPKSRTENKTQKTYNVNKLHFETLINTADIETEILQFFKKFSIQTMPHHNELMNIIKQEIGEEFNLLEDKWITNSLLDKVEDWFKKTEELPLDKSEVEKYYEEIRKDIVMQMTKGNFFVQTLCAHNITFGTMPNNWKRFLDPVKSDCMENKLLLLTTVEPILTAIKVENTIRLFDFYQKQKSFIMSPASVLLQMENKTKYLTNILKSKRLYTLIVVVDDNQAATRSLLNYHLETLGKKVILITTEEASAYENLTKIFTFEEEEDCFNFNHLTKESQDLIMKNMVKFQGQYVAVKTIINNAFHLIDAKTLMDIISSNSFEIGAKIEPYKEYDENSYIERKIGLIKMRDNFLKKKTFSKSLFFIEANTIREVHKFLKHKNIDESRICIRKWNSLSNFVISDTKNAEKDFQQLNKNSADHGIFRFRFGNNGLFWFDCTAADADLKDTLKSFTELVYEDEEIALDCLKMSKTLIITDSPGMGKSTLLTSLSMKFANSVLKWMVRIDLNKYTKCLSELKDSQFTSISDDYQDIGKYVMYKIFNKNFLNHEKKPFAIRVFDEMFRRNQVLLIFDGFDEISPDYEEIVLKIFERIRNSTENQLWITSRLNMKQTLEQKLNTISFSIMPFTAENQQRFLIQFWKNNWKKSWLENNDHHIHIYAKSLIQEFNYMIKRNNINIIGIPLHIKMLSDIFQENEEADDNWQSCYKFINDTTKCVFKECGCVPLIKNKLQNLYILYDSVVKKHINRYLNQKQAIDCSNVGWSLMKTMYYNEIYKVHKILGILTLVDESLLNKLLTKSDYEIKTCWMEKIKTGEANFGLISYVSPDNKPFFTHRTFAEFFAANFLVEKMVLQPLETFTLIDTILQNGVPVFLYCLKHLILSEATNGKFNKAFNGTSVINFVSKYGLSNCLEYFTVDDDFEEFFYSFDELNKTALHYAVEFNHFKCVIFIILHKYNRLMKSEVHDGTLIKEKYRKLIKMENNARLFLLQDFITKTDVTGKTAIEYSTNPNITKFLNDLVKIGRTDLVLKKRFRSVLSRVQWFRSEHKFTEVVLRSLFLFDSIVYSCSLKTILWILHYFETMLITNNIFSKEEERNFFDIISSRSDISEDQKIEFFTIIYADEPIPELEPKIIAYVLCSSIIHDNQKVFEQFFIQENIQDFPTKFNRCFTVACEINKLNVVNFLITKIQENSKLLDSLCAVETNIIILKRIFEIFEGNIVMEREYAGKVLLLVLSRLYSNPSIDKIAFLLLKGADVYLTDEWERTSFDYVIEDGNDDLIKLMIPHISECKIKELMEKYLYDKSHHQVFNYFQAFELDDELIGTFFIQECSNVNIKNETGMTLLSCACKKGWSHATHLMLEKGAYYLDVCDENGKLFDYCQENVEIFELLEGNKYFLENAFSNDFEIIKDDNPLWYNAACVGDSSYIISDWDPQNYDNLYNYQDLNGNTALHIAAEKGFTKVVKKLLKVGAYYNIKNNNNKTPKDFTSNDEILKMFTDVEHMFELVNGNVELQDNTIFNGAKKFLFKVRDSFGMTLLHYAVIKGYSFYIKNILFRAIKDDYGDYSIDKHLISAKDMNQKTPLYYAIENNNLKVTKLLFQSIVPSERSGYYEEIEENQCTRYIKMMDELFTDIHNEDYEGFIKKADTFEVSPISGFNIFDIMYYKTTSRKNSDMKWANVFLKNYEWIIVLLKMGVTFSRYKMKDKRIEWTLSIIEKIFECVDSIDYTTSSIIRLIEQNNLTEIMTKTKTPITNRTLLHTTAKSGNLKMMKWLIKNGADLSAKDFFKKTPIQIAQENHKTEIIHFLQEHDYEDGKNTKVQNNIKHRVMHIVISIIGLLLISAIIFLLKGT